MIKGESSWSTSLFIPLSAAALYTILTPLFRWGISYFNLWISQKQEKSESSLLGSSVIGRKYMRTRDRVKKYEENLAFAIESEESIRTERDNAVDDLHKKEIEHIKLKGQLSSVSDKLSNSEKLYEEKKKEVKLLNERLSTTENRLRSSQEELDATSVNLRMTEARLVDMESLAVKLQNDHDKLQTDYKTITNELTTQSRWRAEKLKEMEMMSDVRILDGDWVGEIFQDNRKFKIRLNISIDRSQLNYTITGAGEFSFSLRIINIVRKSQLIYMQTDATRRIPDIPDPFAGFIQFIPGQLMEDNVYNVIDMRGAKGLDEFSFIRFVRVLA
jgi:hypothetical protein